MTYHTEYFRDLFANFIYIQRKFLKSDKKPQNETLLQILFRLIKIEIFR